MEYKVSINYRQVTFDTKKLPKYFTGADIKVYKNNEEGKILIWVKCPSQEIKWNIWDNKRTISKNTEAIMAALKDNNIIQSQKNWETVRCNDIEKQFEEKCKSLDIASEWYFFIKIKESVIAKL